MKKILSKLDHQLESLDEVEIGQIPQINNSNQTRSPLSKKQTLMMMESNRHSPDEKRLLRKVTARKLTVDESK